MLKAYILGLITPCLFYLLQDAFKGVKNARCYFIRYDKSQINDPCGLLNSSNKEIIIKRQ